MTEPAQTDPTDAVREQCAEWLREALALRRVEIPASNAPPQQFYETLLETRQRLDRVETLLGLAMGLRGSTARRRNDLHDVTEDAWDSAASTSRQHRPVTKEFEGARERYADWNLTVLPQRMEERQMQRIRDQAKETEDRIKLVHDGLRDVRQDCLRAVGYLQWESSLER